MRTELSAFEKRLRHRSAGIVAVHALRGFLIALLGVSLTSYAALALFYFFPFFPSVTIPASSFVIFFFGFPLGVSLLAALLYWRDTRQLTLTLEKSYPHLRDRLSTVLELTTKSHFATVNPVSRMLARSLEQEVNILLDRFGFQKAASLRKLRGPAGFVAILFLTGAVHATVQPEFFQTAYWRLTQPLAQDSSGPLAPTGGLPAFEIHVLPGHCEIVRGSNLMVRAHISGYEARQVSIYVRLGKDPAWQVFPMLETTAGEYEFMLTHVTEPGSYYVKADHQSSPTFRIRLLESLAIEKALWRVEFPPYTKLPEQRLDGWRDKLTVPERAVVHLEMTLTQSIRSAALVTDSGKRLPFSLSETSKKITVSFGAEKDLLLRLDAESGSGENLAGLPPLWLQTLPDLAPYFEILEPLQQNYVFPTQEIPFLINVNDDYGIVSVTLVLRHRGQETRLDWFTGNSGKDSLSLNPILELEPLGLRSKDLVFAYLEIKDNYPDAEGHVVRSPLFVFLIRDFIEEFRITDLPPEEPSLREIFEDLLVEQEKILQDTWDYLSLSGQDMPRGWEDRPPLAITAIRPETQRGVRQNS